MKFFLDPGAGAQRIINARGRLQQVDRLEHGFHYSWLPTAEYRERFGHAAYARTAGTGTVVSLAATDGSELIPSDHEPLVWQPGGAELVALPDEVLEAGTTFLSALVHPRAPFILLVRALRDEQLGRPWPADCPTDWPAESGGAAALAQIIERVRALIANPELEEPPPETAPRSTGDFVLYRLLTAERERQRRGMVEALKRVVDLMP
jgi:hypothetical protein